jgi:tetratricopeptide (TPR) repeat protein
VIPLGARLKRFVRAKPFRALAAAVSLTVLIAVACLNLWAWHEFREANHLVDEQRHSQAHAHYTRCLQVWRWSAYTHLHASRAARRAGLYQEAERHLAESARLQGASSTDSFPLALERLLLQAQSGDISDVEQILWAYIKKDKPETPLILEAMARGYARLFRTAAAMGCLQMLLEREPDNIEALLTRGGIQAGASDPEPALNDYRHVLELDAERDDARLSLARLLLDYNRQEALSHFEIVVAHQPDNMDALVGLAETYWALGEPEKARHFFIALLAKRPENSRALLGLGAVTLSSGDTVEAEALLRKAIAADQGNVKAYFRLYACLAQQQGREAEAEAQLEAHKRVKADFERLGLLESKELSRTPNDPNLHYEMGAIYLRYGKPDVGVRWLYSALRLDPTHQSSHRALYDYYTRVGQTDKAERHHKEIDSKHGTTPTTHP